MIRDCLVKVSLIRDLTINCELYTQFTIFVVPSNVRFTVYTQIHFKQLLFN